jgi:hypothetical protein
MEAVQLGTVTPETRITFAVDGGAYVVGTTAHVDGETIMLYPSVPATGAVPGAIYSLQMPAGSVKDLYGNAITESPLYEFRVNGDVTPPTVTDSFPSNAAVDVDPHTSITLTMSEPVQIGSGKVILNSTSGRTVSLDINEIASFVNQDSIPFTKIFFPLGREKLTEGTLYTIQAPAGMVRDVAGNVFAAADIGTFTTLSVSVSYYDYKGLQVEYFPLDEKF